MNPKILLYAPAITLVVFLVSSVTKVGTLMASGSASEFSITEIAPGIYLHSGKHAGLDDPGRGDSANIGFIIGEKCVAVIDTGGSLATGRNLRTAITRHTELPICYVINTHVHFDHVLGNAAFSADKPAFVGHKNLVDSMAANKAFFVEEFSEELAGNDEALVIGPTVAVEATQKLDLGGRELVLTAEAPAHTDADLTVFDTKANLLWSGDLVFRERMPILDASLRGWLAWLDKNPGEVVVIPGHGKAGDTWEQSTQQIRSYLEALLIESRQAIQDGVFLEDALESVAKSAAEDWQLNDRHARNVSKAYRELEWE